MGEDLRRARRLRAERKAKAAALRRLLPLLVGPNRPPLPIDVGRAAGKLAHAKTPCSCWMCGNPRRHRKGADRETPAERRARPGDGG